MFAAIFGRQNPRRSALRALRRIHDDHMNGLAPNDLGQVLANERRAWQRVLAAFQINPNLGVQCNLDAIDALLSACRGQDGDFDYLGLVVPTLVQNSGFLPEEREALTLCLSRRGITAPQRGAPTLRAAPVFRTSYSQAPALA